MLDRSLLAFVGAAPIPLVLDPKKCKLSPVGVAAALHDPAERQARSGARAKALGLVADEPHRLFEFRAGVARIKIRGVLLNDDWIDPWWGESGYKGLSAQFAAALADPDVEAILLDINSAGGVVNGLFDLVDEIHAGRAVGKPIWAVATDTALSAAYAIASAADAVFLPRLGAVGSIGVWTLHTDLSKWLEDVGIKITLISSGARKVDGHPFATLPDDVKARIQADVDHTRQVFAESVARNRSLEVEAVLGTEAGIFDDRDAIGAGLADAVATEKVVVTTLFEEVGAGATLPAA